jgi:glycosyltransferase involved in cell wall biosynthesis
MSDAPLVSVIIAAYNAASHIEETCRSARRQTYPVLEIIVVDDGSTDDTGRVVDAIAAVDSRVRVIHQNNMGVASARNAAIAAAKGEFIAPLDADDLWDPMKIERQVRRMKECGPDTGLVYCWWAWINESGDVLDRSPRWDVEGRVLRRLIEVNFTGCASVPLFRRSGVEAVGGYDAGLQGRGSQGCEDWDLALRIAERYRAAVVRSVLVGYRRRTNSMSSQCDTMWQSQIHVMEALAARDPSLSRAILQRSNGQFALHLAGVSFWSGDYLGACRWTLRARPFTLLLAVMPHVMRMLVKRVLGIGAKRVRISPDHPKFETLNGSHPLIPYARIYARHWREAETNDERAD